MLVQSALTSAENWFSSLKSTERTTLPYETPAGKLCPKRGYSYVIEISNQVRFRHVRV